jgi:putative phage-type endonuclease
MAATHEALPAIQRTPEWLEARQHGIGASEAAAALGLSRWESPYALWARKCGLTPPPEPSIPMQIGTALEPMIAGLYQAETGIALRRVNRLLRSKAHPWMLASLDRRGEDGRLVELKWTARGDGYGEPGTDEVPDEVLVQVVAQMAVTGAASADVAVVRGSRFDIYGPIRRDADAERLVIEGTEAFWGHVTRREQPVVDGSDATARALAAAYPDDNGEELLAGDDVAELARHYRHATGLRDELESEIAALKAQLQAVMGPATALVIPGVGRITWKATKGRAETDWRAMAEQWLPSPRHVAEFTTTKPGSRRFLPRWEEETNG